MLHIEDRRKEQRAVGLKLCALRFLGSHCSDLDCRLSVKENEIQSILKVNKTSQAGGLMDKKLFSLKDYFFSSAVFKRRLKGNFEQSVSSCQKS